MHNNGEEKKITSEDDTIQPLHHEDDSKDRDDEVVHIPRKKGFVWSSGQCNSLLFKSNNDENGKPGGSAIAVDFSQRTFQKTNVF